MNKITIDGVTYTATPTTNPQPTDKTITLDGVTYILAEETVGAIEKIRINGKLYDLKDVEEVGDIKEKALQYNTLTVTPYLDKVDIYARNINGDVRVQPIPAASQKSAGVMSAADKVALDEVKRSSATKVTWDSSSNMNDFKTPGVYDFYGERTRQDDNLPILNASPGHTVSGRLIVLNSSIDGNGDSQDKCITQLLTISNRTGEDGNTYIRTASGASLNSLTWEPWATQQTNVNVGQVDNIDNLKDNGIYSGVWTKGSYNTYPLTFVCIVINDYFIGIEPRRISQFVYGLSKFDGLTVYQSRVWDDSENSWSDWEILNQKKISSMISMEISKIVDNAPETFNTLKKIADWINNDESGAVAMAKAISENKTAIEEEIKRATTAETNAIEQGKRAALIDMYRSIGASYNESNDTFTFNTVAGLSWGEMGVTFVNRDLVYRLHLPRIGQSISNLRVFAPVPNALTSSSIKIQGLNTFYGTGIELFAICTLGSTTYDTYLNSARTDLSPVCTYMYDAFTRCSKLKVVFPINLKGCTTLKKENFAGCVALEELRLLNLPLSLNLDDSPLISKASILYIITNAAPASAITITLHPDAYARLAEDADIVAALEAQPLVTLVSA